MELTRGLLWGEIFSTSFVIVDGKVFDLPNHFKRLELNIRHYFPHLPVAPNGWFDDFFKLPEDASFGRWWGRFDVLFNQKFDFAMEAENWSQLHAVLSFRPIVENNKKLIVAISPFPVSKRFWPDDFKISDYKRVSLERRKLSSDEVLYFNENGLVCELSTSNIFFIKENQFFTPKENDCFYCGLERARFLKFAEEKNYVLNKKNIKILEIDQFDMAFASNSVKGIQQIQSIGKKEFSSTLFFEKIMKEYTEWKNLTF